MRVLITGGCGFVGFNLASHLAIRGHHIFVADNLVRPGSETNVARLRNLGIELVRADIRNPEDLESLPDRFECLVECSAQPSVVSGYTNPVYDFKTNLGGLLNCLELCRTRGMGMIFLSTSRVYSSMRLNSIPCIEEETRWTWDPLMARELWPCGFHPLRGVSSQFDIDGAGKTIYGASKAAADLICQEYADAFNIPVIINRCGVIAGQGQFGVVGQGWITFWIISCLLERPITYLGYKGKQVRDILFIEDFCSLIESELSDMAKHTVCVLNVGGGMCNSISLLEATSVVQRILNKKMLTSYTDSARRCDLRIYCTDNTDAEHNFQWTPQIDLEKGINSIAKWVVDNKDMLISSGL